MVFTYLILRMTFAGILQEANRMAVEQDLAEKTRELKSELLQLSSEYEKGAISVDTFSKEEARILQSLSKLSQSARKNYGDSG